MRDICVLCQVEFHAEENGIYVFEMTETDQIYRVWHADLWKCPSCGREIVHGVAPNPLTEHWQEGFQEMVTKIQGAGVRIVKAYEKPSEVKAR